MTEPLLPGGPERQIFLQALREFRETCEAPLLHPGCPYAVTIEEGHLRNCDEECTQLLLQHQAPPPQDTEVLVGEFSIRRRRPPRARLRRAGSAKPFDAAEIAMSDPATAYSDKRTVSLLHELGDQMAMPPGTPGRRDGIVACMGELDRRGFDTEMLVRHVVAMPATMVIAVRPMLEAALQSEGVELPPVPEGWEFLEVPESAQLEAHLSNLALVRSWFASAPIADVLDWVAPTEDVVALLRAGHLDHEPDEAVRNTLAWTYVRFIVPYLEEWPTEALTAEWAWMHGQRLAPCESKYMDERQFDEDELAKAVAHRLAGNKRPAATRFISHQYVPLAGSLIDEGKVGAAVEVFRVATTFEPDDPNAWNNHGFCLIPLDAAAALSSLQRAADAHEAFGIPEFSYVAANRMFAMRRLGRLTPALALADAALAAPTYPGRMQMWAIDLDPEAPKVIAVTNMPAYILDLAVSIAEETRDELIIQKWTARRAELGD